MAVYKPNQISRKSIQWKQSCSMWTDRWTDWPQDMMRLTFAFHNFGHTP